MSAETPLSLPPDENLSEPPNWRHWTWWLRPIVALPLMLFVLLLLSPFLVRGWHLAKVPDIADPFDVETFLSETVDDKYNAFVDYHAARALLVSGSFSDEEIAAGWEKASPTLQSWLDANRAALNRWRSGTEKVDAIDGDLRISDLVLSYPTVGSARDFARLAWLQGEREQSEGNTSGAWQWYRSAMRFSRHVGHRTNLFGHRFCSYLHRLTAERILRWAGDPRTSGGELELATRQLSEDFRLTRPFSESLKAEYGDIYVKERLNNFEEPSPLSVSGALSSWRDSRFIRYCFAEDESFFRLSKLVTENWLSAGDVPRRLQRRVVGKSCVLLDVTPSRSRMPCTKLRQLLDNHRFQFGEFADASDRFTAELARHEALRLTLACQFWLRKHGVFPATLEDLVPDVLPELPIDPFSPNGDVFRYHRDGEEAVVYSIGLNETDNRGRVDLIPGEWPETGYLDIGYRLVPPRHRERSAEQKPSEEP